MKRLIILIAAAILFLPVCALCAVAKTAGDYELLLETASLGGDAGDMAGNMELHCAIGQPVGHDQFAQDVYELFGGFLGVVDETAPTINISNPASATTIGGPVGITGSVFDENITQWTIEYGAGASPSTWDQLSDGNTNVTSSNLAPWDASLLGGTYSARLTATDDRGNTATSAVSFTIENSLSISGTIPMHKWVFLSMPLGVDPDDPLSLYGTDYEYKVFRWNPDSEYMQDSGRYEYPEHLTAGTGYWVKAYNKDLPYSYNGVLSDTTQDYAVSVKEGWNQIGTPYSENYPWAYVKVGQGAETYDMATAVSMGLLSQTITTFDADINGWVQHDLSTDMEPYTGYNVRAYQDLELLFDPAVIISGSVPRQLSRIIRVPHEFNVKISAAATHSADPDNYFGISPAAAREFDPLDYEEPFHSPGGYFTSLYFDHDNWQRMAGRYANDLRNAAAVTAQSGDWDFNVETNETGQTVTLSWDSSKLPADRYTFTLVDLTTGTRIDMTTQSSYVYTAAGEGNALNSFRIEVRRKDTVQVVRSITLAPGWNLVSVPLDPEVTSALAQLGDDLPILDVFQFFDGKFYPAEEADIQAGIGYWIHVDKNTEIDIEGELPENTIKVPLSIGWNMIGNPYEATVQWSDDAISFICNGARKTLSQAVSEKLVVDGLYEYTGEGYTPAEALLPWHGYFFRSASKCELEITGP